MNLDLGTLAALSAIGTFVILLLAALDVINIV